MLTAHVYLYALIIYHIQYETHIENWNCLKYLILNMVFKVRLKTQFIASSVIASINMSALLPQQSEFSRWLNQNDRR